LSNAVRDAMGKHIPPREKPARRPWIRKGILELIQQRRALAADGRWKRPKAWTSW